MTVSSSIAKSGPYAGAGTTGPFTVGFRFLENSHLRVVRTDANGNDATLTLDADYSVTGAGGATGTVTLVIALAVGEKLTIVRNVPATQEADYVQNDAFPAESHETALDKLTMLFQQADEAIDRAIKVGVADAPLNELPGPAARANMIVGFDATGNVTVLPVTTSIGAGDRIPQTWVGGTDYTAGTTTQLTLARAPGSQGNLEVFFDGIFQAFDQWSVNGTVLTFTTPIPVGTVKVFAYIGTTLSTSIPPATSVGDAQIIWDGSLDRMVPSVAALRALDGTRYAAVGTRGYYAPNGMGKAEFDKDASDTTSADNNGTIIVGADGTRWKMRPRPQVSAACFGVVPGVSNIGARLNQALADHVGKYRLLLPQGTLSTGTTIIDFPSGSDCEGIGPVNSSYGPNISSSPHGTKIVSAVPNDFAVRIAYNAPYVAGGTNVGNFEITNPVGKGMYCQSMGTGAIIHDIGIHDCLQKGAHFSYFQDSSLINLEVVFCGADTDYGVTFDVNCNACRVDKLLIVGCRQPLLVQDSTYFDFYNPHIEQGEYPPGDPNEGLNRAYIAGGFQLKNCQSINFYGGVYVPNSSGYLATFYSIAESATPFYLVTDAFCKNVKMFGPKFSSPRNGSRFLSVTNMEVIGATFNNAVSTVTAVEGTNLKIRDGQAELYDNQAQTALLFGFFGGRSEVSDFEIVCSNPSAATKTSGALIDGTVDVGRYRVTVDKYFSQLGSNATYRGPVGMNGAGYSLAGGVLDLQKQNAGDAIIINTIAGALLSLNNYHGQGDKYTVVNNTAGSLTVGTGGNISTPSTITVPAFGSIDLKHIPGTNIISPVV